MESGLREHTQLEIYVSLSTHVVAEYVSSFFSVNLLIFIQKIKVGTLRLFQT